MSFECDTCKKRFQEPKAVYAIAEGEGTNIVTSDSDEFNWFLWVNEDSWYQCPFCGSDNVTDLEE